MKPIEASYRISESQFMDACELHWKARRQGSLSGTLIGLGAIAIGGAIAWLYAWGLIHKLALAIVFLGALFPLIVILRYFVWRNAYRSSKKFHDTISIAFAENAIHVETAAGISDLNWDAYTAFLDTPEYFILYMTTHTFSVIPKDSFPDADRESLRKLISSKLQPVR